MSLERILNDLRQQVGAAHSKANQLLQENQSLRGDNAVVQRELQNQAQSLSSLNAAFASLRTNSAGGAVTFREGRSMVKTDGKVRYLEDIPGRRIPFDVVVRIPIGTNITALQSQTHIISQDGPFVAVARYACFQSAHQFQVTDDNGITSAFQGRSFGRFRPIHSMWDLNDAQAFNPIVGMAFPGTGAPIVASPSSHSGFRTMEFDGTVTFRNAGAAYPRSNTEVPTAWWTTQINSPFQLGALDFFERGETLQWDVTPSHINNPEGGNISGIVGSYPFLAGQYDVHEGIADVAGDATSDPVQRLPDGFVWIGLHGFRIIQPPGPVEM